MKKMLPIIQAYVDGKVVEYQDAETGEWQAVEDYLFLITVDDKPRYYRIKPEPKYRPFKDAEECWNEMLKHQPFGWIKDENKYYHIACVFDADKEGDNMTIETVGYKSFNGVLACYTFADGTPFGIKEGGEE